MVPNYQNQTLLKRGYDIVACRMPLNMINDTWRCVTPGRSEKYFIKGFKYENRDDRVIASDLRPNPFYISGKVNIRNLYFGIDVDIPFKTILRDIFYSKEIDCPEWTLQYPFKEIDCIEDYIGEMLETFALYGTNYHVELCDLDTAKFITANIAYQLYEVLYYALACYSYDEIRRISTLAALGIMGGLFLLDDANIGYVSPIPNEVIEASSTLFRSPQLISVEEISGKKSDSGPLEAYRGIIFNITELKYSNGNHIYTPYVENGEYISERKMSNED